MISTTWQEDLTENWRAGEELECSRCLTISTPSSSFVLIAGPRTIRRYRLRHEFAISRSQTHSKGYRYKVLYRYIQLTWPSGFAMRRAREDQLQELMGSDISC